MNEPQVDLKCAREHGLTDDEYKYILKILGRTPTFTELGIFSVMWSEHCSYKNSILMLKTFPKKGERLLVEAGEENAGLIDIGDGLAVAFKIESHNHPSAVEPYQGAATGVGGILRDIFSMGARPIAALNSLRFGNLDDPRVRYLFSGVVRGIGDYGNCFGVPTVGGEIYFDESYNGNPLVNCMAVGIVKHDRVAKALADEPGASVLYFGSATGRDGIHGATFASEEINEKSEERRPQVQVGDPFAEKLLLEATLEMIEQDLLIGIQDMGAAGLTCSSSEMAATGTGGMLMDLDKIPKREKGMTAYEILLSESQERMLAVVKKGKEDAVKAICAKWDLSCAVVGKVTDGKDLIIRKDGEIKAQIPSDALVLGGSAPVYKRETRRPDYLDELQNFDFSVLPEPNDYNEILMKLLASPNIASKQWVYKQYDHMVRSNTMNLPGLGAAVVRIKGGRRALAMATDCNGRLVYLNPREGGKIAVAESARNVVCSGAKPVAITNCLNFGNPYKPEIYWQFEQAVLGVGDACRALETPVTGGNVSFYNENPEGAVFPTPVIGMLGLIDDIDHVTTSAFKNEGDTIYLLGKNSGDISGSEYLKTCFGRLAGNPQIDLNLEARLQQACLAMIRSGNIHSAHDISDGGLAIALAECCIVDCHRQIGAKVTLPVNSRSDFMLFGETQSQIIISCAESSGGEIEKIANQCNVMLTRLGSVGGSKLIINSEITADISKLSEIYYTAISQKMAD